MKTSPINKIAKIMKELKELPNLELAELTCRFTGGTKIAQTVRNEDNIRKATAREYKAMRKEMKL